MLKNILQKKYSIKQKFIFSFAIYVLGFVVLYSIGDKLNKNPYHSSAFFSSLFILLGMAGMVLSLTSKKEIKPSNKAENKTEKKVRK